MRRPSGERLVGGRWTETDVGNVKTSVPHHSQTGIVWQQVADWELAVKQPWFVHKIYGKQR